MAILAPVVIFGVVPRMGSVWILTAMLATVKILMISLKISVVVFSALVGVFAERQAQHVKKITAPIGSERIA